jgi:heat shock protein HslJ
MLRPVLAAALVLLLAACQSAPGGPGPAQWQLLMDSWILDTFEDQSVSALLPLGARAPSLSISPDGAVTGNTGVNALGTTLDLSGLESGRFSVGRIATTRRAGPPTLMVIETAFLEDLGKADAFKVKGTTLTLLSKDAPVLVFTRREEEKK